MHYTPYTKYEYAFCTMLAQRYSTSDGPWFDPGIFQESLGLWGTGNTKGNGYFYSALMMHFYTYFAFHKSCKFMVFNGTMYLFTTLCLKLRSYHFGLKVNVAYIMILFIHPCSCQMLLNSLRPSDAIWRQWSWTTLAQVMACCLTAPSHYLNQCWLIIRGVLWHTSESSFAGIAQGIDSGYEFEKDILKNIFKSPRGQWVNDA